MKSKILALAVCAFLSPSLSQSVYAYDWMAEISGSCYINQLSIPGSHDCGTGNGFTGFLGGLAGSSSALTQDLNLSAQWDCGVRAFDLRPTVKSGSLEIYHGVCQTKLSLEGALNTLCQKLDEHPTEFAMVFLRHENDADNDDSSWADKMAALFEKFADRIVAWAPDLTLDMVSGKMVVFTRDAFDFPSVALITKWSHSSDFSSWRLTTASCGSRSGRMYVQDFYDCTGTNGAQTKINSVKRMYEISSTLNKESAGMIQAVNHTSGYTTSASTNGNRDLASQANGALLESLSDESLTPGPTGVVLMDFAGVDTSGKYTVHGKELVDAIIAHNFRYTMLNNEPDPEPEPKPDPDPDPEPEPEPDPEPDPNASLTGVEVDVTAPSVYFDLAGRRVVNPTRPGIYFLAGRKVLIW